VNGRVAGPVGHDSPTACPHGVYATAGVERYVAVAVETEEQWAGLRSVVSFDGVSGGLEGLEERQKVRAALDAGLREFCAERDPFEVAEQLRAAGVPAYAVLRPTDLYEDPQLAHREFFVTWEHAELGPIPSDGLVTHFSRTPGRLGPAPTLGEHTHEVLTEILGLSDDEIAEYAALGALT
jgi:crotonobetainyl-CoA:carnitine CoA-transferase CaiB-like acyl-CoA transferase